MKKSLLFLLSLLFTISSFSQFVYIENKTFKVNNCPIYFNGANTPWDNWNDFGGNYDANFWSTHFATLKANGINASRVWISCNGDVQPNISSDGTVNGMSSQFLANLDNFFQAAQTNGVYIMATMMSFDHTKNTYTKYNSWRNMLNDLTKVQTYIDNYLVPFVNRYKTNPYLMSIDLCNEPEWIAEDANNMRCSYSVLQRFFARSAAAIHNNPRTDGSTVLVTIGSAATKWNATKMRQGSNGAWSQNNPDGNKWSDAALMGQYNQANAIIDYYSPHYYAWINEYYSNPYERTPTDFGINEKACLIGETPAGNPGTPNLTPLASYEALKSNGYQGHFPWTSNGVDAIGGIEKFGTDALAFKNKYSSLVYPTCSVTPTIVGTPPSCVITAPHVNAYFQSTTTITINVAARDIGGTNANGTVTKVEFYQGTTKLGEDLTSPYSYAWTNVPAGTYTLTAKATDNDANVSTSAGVIITVGTTAVGAKGMSACKGKYLANIIAGSVRSDFNTYWNGVTSENDCKWGSVESTRDNFNWTGADRVYNHAKNNNLPFRYHVLAWGSQYPSWITSLSPADFKIEMEEYMAAVAARYPLIDQIDVLNEAVGTHAAGTPYFRDGLGGANGGVAPDNNTGYDWAVWLFRKARHYFPNSKLVLNDYGLENDPSAITSMLAMMKVLRDRNLVDGFGTQAHTFNVDGLSAATLQSRLDAMAAGGVPIYVTELDLTGSPANNEGTEATQNTSYQTLFPVYWNHQHVAGVTLWGYVEGQTWRNGTGLLRADGSEKPAMTWLKQYMAGRTDVGYPFCGTGDPNPPGGNLLTNPEFDNGTTGWDIQNNETGSGTMTVVNPGNMSGPNALKICATSAGTADWHVQVRQNAPFEAGKTYTISFMARADANRTMNIGIQMEGTPWTSHFGATTNLTTTNQNFSYTFSPTVTDATAKLKFYVGTSTTCVYIDKVVFQEGTVTNQSPTVSLTTPANNSSYCQGSAITLTASAADTDGTISKVEFYDGTTLLSTITTNPYTYSWTNASSGAHTITAKATDNGNAATTSSVINITINSVPSAPTVTTPVTYCQNATATALTASGSNLKWYTSPSTGTGSSTAPTPNTTATGTTNHYVSQTVTGCESPRALIAVTVNANPSAPTVTTPVTYCQNATATALTASGSDLKWYTSPSTGTGSPTAPAPSTTTAGSTNHYVSQTISGCESSRAEIAVIITSAPSQASAGPDQYVTSPSATLEGNTPTSGTGQWIVTTGTGIFSNASQANTSVSSLSTGANTFQWKITTSGSCSASTDEVIIHLGSTPGNQSISGSGTVNLNESYTFTVPVDPGPNTVYTWNLPTGAFITSGAGTNSITVNFPTGTQSGNVSVSVTNSFGTGGGSLPVTVNTPTSIHSSLGEMSCSMYPNPFTEELNITVQTGTREKLTLRVIDMKGKVIYESDEFYTNEEISIGESLPQGLFMIQAIGNGKISSAKIEKLK